MDEELIREEMHYRVSRSSGPGGQHAQKSSTRVEALFEVEPSAGLSEAERRRVLARLGPLVRSISQDERSQLRNRELATKRILDQLAAASKPVRTRKKTAPTGASVERRLEVKRRVSAKKRLREPPEE